MDDHNQILQWIVGSVLLLLIMYGLWNGASWLFIEALNLTPKKLAIFSLGVVVIPVVLTIVLLAGKSNVGSSNIALFTMFIMPFGVFGLAMSGVWALIK